MYKAKSMPWFWKNRGFSGTVNSKPQIVPICGKEKEGGRERERRLGKYAVINSRHLVFNQTWNLGVLGAYM